MRDPALVAAAARLYALGLRADEPLDAVVAAFLRGHMKGADDEDRGFVVDTAQGMWRRRRLLDAIGEALAPRTGPPTREALACAALVLEGAAPGELPIDRRGGEVLRQVVFDVAERAPLDVRASLPPWLCERFVAIGGEALALSSTTAPPQTLRVNTLRTTREELQQALADEGIDTTPCARSPIGLHVTRRRNVFRTRAFRDGWFEIQDEGSQLVAALAGAQPGLRVVDACAGAGGKTLAMAAAMNNKGTLLAFDVHGGRLKALRARCARAGVDNVRVYDLDEAPKARKRFAERCDVVLVDAPCSGTGVLRRNPDTGWSLRPADVQRLTVTQHDILARAARWVRPGGRLVYATCSVLPEENDDVVTAFLSATPDFVRVEGLTLLPTVGGPDGFFAAVLVRGASPAEADPS